MPAEQLALSFRAVRPAECPPMVLRDPSCARSTGGWTRDGFGWRSDNGWTIRRTHVVPSSHRRGDENGWGAYAPDGFPEWWADDPATAMERAEGFR